MTALAEMLGEGDVVAQVRDLLDERGGLMVERDALLDAAITAMVERAVRVPTAAALVEELVRLRQPQTPDAITAAVAEVVESEAVRALLRDGLAQAMGPAQRRPVAREGESGGFFSY